jgi:hypothetical protein
MKLYVFTLTFVLIAGSVLAKPDFKNPILVNPSIRKPLPLEKFKESQIKSVRGGGQEGNGGDGSSIEFKQMGLFILNEIEAGGIFEVQGIKMSDVKDALQKARIDMVPHDLELNGIKKDAINYPREQRIEVNIASWNANQSLGVGVMLGFK